MTFGERLKERRNELGITQEELGASINEELSRQAVSKWERDEAYPEVDKLLILAAKLDISLDELFADELKYLKRGKQETDDFAEKYPGILAGVKTFAEILKKMDL